VFVRFSVIRCTFNPVILPLSCIVSFSLSVLYHFSNVILGNLIYLL
jgi:hypothetical protein